MSDPSASNQTVDDGVQATLVVTSSCPHCASMLTLLSKMLKNGDIATLKLINADRAKSLALQLGVRSVPWLALDYVRLTGGLSEAELHRWVGKIQTGEAMTEYLLSALGSGRLDEVTELVQGNRRYLLGIIELLKLPTLEFKVKLGVSAVVEQIQGSDILQSCIGELGELLKSAEDSVRVDVLYFLSLSASQDAVVYVRPFVDNPNPVVREAALEALQTLG